MNFLNQFGGLIETEIHFSDVDLVNMVDSTVAQRNFSVLEDEHIGDQIFIKTNRSLIVVHDHTDRSGASRDVGPP